MLLKDLAITFGAVALPLGVAGFVAFVVLGWCAPFMMFSATRSLRKIARELERANDYREHYEHGARPAAIGEGSRARL